jgi:hypothetical protein
VEFKSEPKISTHIGPLLKYVFFLIFRFFWQFLGIATHFRSSAGDALAMPPAR